MQKEYGYQQVITPHIGNKELYVTSGHYAKYGKDSFQPIHTPDRGRGVPAQADELSRTTARSTRVKPRSYKDLPIRLAEFGTVYRYEQTGELHGLTRVRGFTQDDAHMFVRPDQLLEEFEKVIDIILYIFAHAEVRQLHRPDLAARPERTREKYIGTDENWEKAEQAIMPCRGGEGISTTAMEIRRSGLLRSEARLHGASDAIGRKWQLGTIQVDYNLPEAVRPRPTRAPTTKLHRPIMIHRAPFGSMERFVAVLLEHTGGQIPAVALARPGGRAADLGEVQRLCPARWPKYLNRNDVRAQVDDRNEKIGRKIRDNELKRIPYLLIVGEKEEAEGHSLRSARRAKATRAR